MEHIVWPQPSQIAPSKRHKTVEQITSLCYNAGFLVSGLYLLVSLVVKPLLQQVEKQRFELTYAVLLKLRRLVTLLSRRIKTDSVAVIGFNERTARITSSEGDTKEVCYVDRCAKTSEADYEELLFKQRPEDPTLLLWNRTHSRLEDIITKLNTFNYTNADTLDNADSFVFETKLAHDSISNDIDLLAWNRRCDEITESLVEIKSWFIRGRIPG